jgi:hypothetical protein
MAMLGHPILGDRRYHYGWAAQHERMAQADPVTRAAFQPHSKASACLGVDVAATAQANAPDAPQAVAGQALSNACADRVTAQAGAEEPAELRDFNADAVTGQQGAGSVEAEAAHYASAQPDGRSAWSGTVPDGGGLCLWAVQVDLQHPVTKEDLRVCIPEPEHYAALRAAHEAGTVR